MKKHPPETSLLAVSFYTPEYSEIVPRLIASCAEHGQELHVEQLPTMRDWARNCGMKATFLRRAIDANPGRPLVWLDADAEVLAPIGQMKHIDCDIAVRFRRDRHGNQELLSGTILIQPTDLAQRLVNRWQYFQQQMPCDWDQQVLQRALPESVANVHPLDPIYCAIVDERIEGARIVHHQASRVTRAAIREANNPPSRAGTRRLVRSA